MTTTENTGTPVPTAYTLSDGGTFRTYPAFDSVDSRGRRVSMALCEELVNGRWEPFYSCDTFGAQS